MLRSVALTKYGPQKAISCSWNALWGLEVGGWQLRSPRVRVGHDRERKTTSGGTVLGLFDDPFVLYQLIMLNMVSLDRKNLSCVKGSRAIVVPLSKKRAKPEIVESNSHKT